MELALAYTSNKRWH